MYNNIRKKVNKFYNGGTLESRRDSGTERRIPKYQNPFGGIGDPMYGVDIEGAVLLRLQMIQGAINTGIMNMNDPGLPTSLTSSVTGLTVEPIRRSTQVMTPIENNIVGTIAGGPNAQDILDKGLGNIKALNQEKILLNLLDIAKAKSYSEGAGVAASLMNAIPGLDGTRGALKAVANSDIMESNPAAGKAAIAMNVLGDAGQFIDKLFMSDKNFGALSEAIDSAVHGASLALLKSGNPYAALAAGALETANFLTKAGGETVQGFDVDINSSGYGQMGHMESSSSRDWGAAIGLGGLFGRDKMKRKLDKRNEQARMALEAADIADELRFEQEARMDSISNVIANNQAALAGGIELGSLGA